MNILHIAHHDEKFFLAAEEIFRVGGDVNNLFVVLARDIRRAREYFHGKQNFRVVNRNYIYSAALARDLAWCDCLVVHYLDGLKAKAILRAPPNLPVVWSGWGGDYYDLLSQGGDSLFGEKTLTLKKKLDRELVFNYEGAKRAFINLAREIRASLFWGPRIRKAAFRANYFSSPFPGDFDLLKNNFGARFSPIYTRIFYGSVERTYMPGPYRVDGRDILVGNSAYAENNHLEVFDMLSRIDLGDRKIIVPLSYGDPVYRDAIIAAGHQMFGQRIKPIVDFMPLDRYNTLISTCAIAVMGHRRQQGGGNVVTMLYKGGKVFLDERSTTLMNYFKSRGGFIFSHADLVREGARAFDPLTEGQVQKNKEILHAYSGNEVVRQAVMEFIQMIRATVPAQL